MVNMFCLGLFCLFAFSVSEDNTLYQMGVDFGGNQRSEFLEDDYTTDLLLAAMSGDLNLLASSLSSGAKLSAQDSFGRTPLELAAINGKVEMVEELLRLGAGGRDAGGSALVERLNMLREENNEDGDVDMASRLSLVIEALKGGRSAFSVIDSL